MKRKGIGKRMTVCLATFAMVFGMTGFQAEIAKADVSEETAEEIRVLTCEKKEHQHTDACYGKKLICQMEDHTHDDSCEELVLTCDIEEHSHEQAGEAYKECKIREHTHTDSCYKTKKKHWWGKKEKVLVCCQKEHTHQEGVCCGYVAEQKLICKHHISCLFGKHSKDCYKDVFCTKQNHTHTDSCYEKQLTCQKHVHSDACYDNHVLICTEEEHQHTDECYTAVPASYKVSYYMLKPGIAMPIGTVSDPTEHWINMNTSIRVKTDPKGSTDDKELIDQVLGTSEDVLKEYDKTLEYNGTVYTYAKAEVFRIMKENDYPRVGYHADCRMIRGYSDQGVVPYAKNDVFVLYVDEDGAVIDQEYLTAEDGKIAVTKQLDENFDKIKDDKYYGFSQWMDEDGNAVEVNGTIDVGDKETIILKACYEEQPLARFFLLYKDRNEEIPDENVDDPVIKYTKAKIYGALTKGVVTYEENGALAIPDDGYAAVEDYLRKGPSAEEIKQLLIEAGYTQEEIEYYGLTIDWFRTMSYSHENYYHVDGRVIAARNADEIVES